MSDSCNPIDSSLPGSSVHGILQARILEWVAISSSRESSQPRNRTQSPAFRQIIYQLSYKKERKEEKEIEVAQLCPTLWDPMDCSLPGSSVRGIFQARVLEWGATAFSRFRSTAAVAKSLQLCPTLCNPIDGSPPGSPIFGTLQARTLEWVAISFCNESEVAQLCPTLVDPMKCSPPGSSVHGIFQARVLKWGAIVFSENH